MFVGRSGLRSLASSSYCIRYYWAPLSGNCSSQGQQKTTMLFRYEKLSDFCNICGILDHVDKDCPSLFEGVTSDLHNKK